MNEADELEYLVLSLLGQSEEPVGSGAICDWLRKNGQATSEATVGRYLRQLDFRGLTERDGYRGRVLSDTGHDRLNELQRERVMTRSSHDLMRALSGEHLSEVIDVLVARRALEREIARLAATRASERDVAALEELVERYEAATQSQAAATIDFAFHVRLAELTGNRVLQAATSLIHTQAHSAMIPANVYRKMKPGLARQHREIVEAIRQHDPDHAEHVMVSHIDHIIGVLQKYGQDAPAEVNA
ncbi:MAG TPA: FCD domain-containing protein [Symbiobacteriaceae bacterium]|nr:FCD domain-containing protein [Symbiobacteriaceae bacterium]